MKISICILFSTFATCAQQKAVSLQKHTEEGLQIEASMYKGSFDDSYFSYSIRNLNKETIYFDTLNLYTAYFLKPRDTIQSNYISFRMIGSTSNEVVTIFPLEKGKTFVKKIKLDSANFKSFLFEFAFFTRSELDKLGLVENPERYQLNNEIYINRAKIIRVKSSKTD